MNRLRSIYVNEHASSSFTAFKSDRTSVSRSRYPTERLKFHTSNMSLLNLSWKKVYWYSLDYLLVARAAIVYWYSLDYLLVARAAIADTFLAPQILAAARFEIDMSRYPTLARLKEAYDEHPAFQAALPTNQPDAPSPSDI